MPGYTELMSEQIVIGDHITYTTKTTATATGSAVDMRDYHRALLYVLGGATVGTITAKLQASSSSAFGGTPTTVTSTTTKAASCTASLDMDAEQVQAKRAKHDRYIRAKITGTGASKFSGLLLKDCRRYKK